MGRPTRPGAIVAGSGLHARSALLHQLRPGVVRQIPQSELDISNPQWRSLARRVSVSIESKKSNLYLSNQQQTKQLTNFILIN